MKKFDRVVLKALRSEIDVALRPIAEKYSISLTLGSTTFEPSRFAAKIEGAVLDGDGQPASKEAENFTRYAQVFGFLPDDLGKSIMLSGKPYTIIGLRPTAPKRPVLLEDANGRRNVVAPAPSVLLALRPGNPAPIFGSQGPRGRKSV